jgi:hypothetical protein
VVALGSHGGGAGGRAAPRGLRSPRNRPPHSRQHGNTHRGAHPRPLRAPPKITCSSIASSLTRASKANSRAG